MPPAVVPATDAAQLPVALRVERAAMGLRAALAQARHQAVRRLIRLIAGNPVTMGQMTRHLPRQVRAESISELKAADE